VRPRRLLLAALALVGPGLAACRGQVSEEPPIRPIRHMFQQPRFDTQEENPFFADRRAMRPPVPGTVVAGRPRDDAFFYRGVVDGKPAATLPVPLTPQLLQRGRERYNVFCAPCHDGAGTGQSVVAQRGLQPPPPSLHEDRLRREPVGHFYQVITKGVRTMPSYAAQVPPDDRWAIAAYLRALQLSQDAPRAAVPADVRAAKGWSE
jgi:mono/diheme cytochrome c family protein